MSHLQVIHKSFTSHSQVIPYHCHIGIVWLKDNELNIRLWDSCNTNVEKHVRLAQNIQTSVHLMGVKFDNAKHVSGLHPNALTQRASRNLCGIHVFALAWMIATDQIDDTYDFNHTVVDVIHDYVEELLLSGDDRICYKLTPIEKVNNDFRVFQPAPFVKQTGYPIVIG